MNTDDMRQHFEPDGSPRRLDSGMAVGVPPPATSWASVPQKPLISDHIRRMRSEVKRWAYLNIWCRYCYRVTMRIIHRFNIHYAPPGPICERRGQRNQWCQWCGLRGTTYVIDDVLAKEIADELTRPNVERIDPPTQDPGQPLIRPSHQPPNQQT